MVVSRDQDIVLRDVPIDAVATIRTRLRQEGLFLLGDGPVARVRACTGSAVCALGITTAPDAGEAIRPSAALARNSSLRVHVSGCPNSCAQHQAADIGLAGSKVRINGRTVDGYQVFLGADLDDHLIGEVVGRVAAEDVSPAVDAIVGSWEALRDAGEPLGRTVRRVGLDAFAAHLTSVMDDQWASGPEVPEIRGETLAHPRP